MDQERIEEWFEREKERISEEYFNKLRAHENTNVDKLRKEFEAKLKKTIDSYNKQYSTLFAQEETKKKLQAPRKKIREFLDELSSKFSEKDE